MVGDFSLGPPLGVDPVGQIRLRIQNKQTDILYVISCIYFISQPCKSGICYDSPDMNTYDRYLQAWHKLHKHQLRYSINCTLLFKCTDNDWPLLNSNALNAFKVCHRFSLLNNQVFLCDTCTTC